jgi:hypothetical protein
MRGVTMDKDNINPDHYAKSCSLECIEAMELAFGDRAVYNFCICNAWKYLWRWKNKNGVEDLYKADWYAVRAGRYYKVMEPELVNRLRDFIVNEIDICEEMEEQHGE